MSVVQVGDVRFGNALPMVLIAGPCQLETTDHALRIAGTMAETCRSLRIGYVFKGSFDKANRTSLSGARGPGLEDGLRMLEAVRREVGCPVLTDIHLPDQCAPVAEVADILQIPALLCRQTDLLLAAGRTGAAVNIKKGQFMAPDEMPYPAGKVASTGNARILLTERGTSFGHHALVNDMRGLAVMAETGYPVIFDATHSVQEPGGLGGSSGGQGRFVAPLARAAVALGVAAVFIETHPDPGAAPSDGPCMLPLDDMAPLLHRLVALDRVAKQPG